MPELPEVQIFKEYLDSTSLHKRIQDIEVKSKQILQDITENDLSAKLKGEEFLSSQRHGKYLFASVSGKFWLVFHFGMTGDLIYFKELNEEPAHDRLLITFKNGYHLAFDNQRKFGKIIVTPTVDEFVSNKKLGKDALQIDLPDFTEAMKKKRGSVKSVLMDQHTIAGIGNLYSDEILFQTGVHPKKRVSELDEKTLKDLHSNIRRVLKTAIENQADPKHFPKDYLLHNRVKGAPCSGCDGKIETITVSGRTAYFCPNCQK